MGQKELEDMKRRMAEVKAPAKVSPNPPANRGGMGGGLGVDNPPKETATSGQTPLGIKTLPEKQSIAEELAARGKAMDVEDTREETTDRNARHDLVAGKELNIPPTIQAERMKMGLHPMTGDPWTVEDRRAYERELDRSRVDHAAAVRESEVRMQKDQAAPARIQPVPHVPTTFLTTEQRRAQQEAQDAGESPVNQARARDDNHPDIVGRQIGDKRTAMTDQQRQREEAGVDEDIERQEVEGVDDVDEEDNEPDPDEVEADLNKSNR